MKTIEDMQQCNYKVGDKVVYKDILAVVDSVSPVFSYEFWLISLTSVDDEQMTCTARESECEPYHEDTFDSELQKEALSDARFNSRLIAKMVDGLTDKHYID